MGSTNHRGRDPEFSWTRRILSEVIENFSKIAKPMTELLKKDTKFKWTKECEASFQELKKRLVTSPVLILLDQSKDYEVYCDASCRGLGAVLMQEGRVVSYASR